MVCVGFPIHARNLLTEPCEGNDRGRVLGPRFFNRPPSPRNSHPWTIPRANAARPHELATNSSQDDGQVPGIPFPPSQPNIHHAESDFCSTPPPPVPCNSVRAGVHRVPNRQPRPFVPRTAGSGHVPASYTTHPPIPHQISQPTAQWRAPPQHHTSHTRPSSNARFSSVAGMAGQTIPNEAFSLEPRYTGHHGGVQHSVPSRPMTRPMIQRRTDGKHPRDLGPGQHGGRRSSLVDRGGPNDFGVGVGQSYHHGGGGFQDADRFGVSSRAAYERHATRASEAAAHRFDGVFF
jgi:hypothetical protein